MAEGPLAVDVLVEKAADAYEADVAATVDGLTSLLEPLLVAVIGAVVGTMLICLYLPMFNIAQNIKSTTPRPNAPPVY